MANAGSFLQISGNDGEQSRANRVTADLGAEQPLATQRRSTVRASIEGAGAVGDSLAAAFVLILMTVIVYEVIARYLFNSPTGFAAQFSAYAMPFIAFLAAAATLRRNGHVAVDALVNVLCERARALLEVLTEGFSAVVITVIAITAGLAVMETWDNGTMTFSTAGTFPEYLPQIVMPIGLILLALQQMVAFFDSARRYRSRGG